MAFLNIAIIVWDWTMFFANIVLLKRPVGKVFPQGHAGAGGKWPEYVPARRATAGAHALRRMPWLTMNITFTELNQAVRATYNFAPSFCLFVPHFVAEYLSKDYAKDTFSLHKINKHNAVEHDVHSRSQICVPFVEGLLASATGKDAHAAPLLLPKDLSAYSGKRRADARATNSDLNRRPRLTCMSSVKRLRATSPDAMNSGASHRPGSVRRGVWIPPAACKR
ncbi:hypothetical protein FIBSPDRAFT_1053723 [Athelia psychrophila]|uniref:Heme haloperoxidase family profile domain-containing protein n=1 Tax=Athelia psychrophila TaxID=1759441 RepID=A0A167WH69_9AGAM|nr:hypothetical protein FIBSPDRAFT_1053723 [Fibularhizoctonia sp. CBS 109695]